MKKHLTHIPRVELPTEFSVIGEHWFDPSRLLLRGTDGQFFELRLEDGLVTAAHLGGEWVMDDAPHIPSPYKVA